MQKIVPFFWFDNQAEDAANFYVSLFPNSRIAALHRYGDAGPGPAGSVMSADLLLDGFAIYCLNGGPVYSVNPAVSLFVACADGEIDALWRRLADGGKVLMPLTKYPFSEKFGWVADRFGLSWQLILAPGPQRITPFLLFTGPQKGRAADAIAHYVSIFDHARVEQLERWGPGAPEPAGFVKRALFRLENQPFMALDSALPHQFTFTPGTSFFVHCQNQDEVDILWDQLLAGGKPSRCGWLTDKFGFSWQIVPTVLGQMLGDKDPARARRTMKAMLQMVKLDVAQLQAAYDGGS